MEKGHQSCAQISASAFAAYQCSETREHVTQRHHTLLPQEMRKGIFGVEKKEGPEQNHYGFKHRQPGG